MKNSVLEPIRPASGSDSSGATMGIASEIADRIARSIAYMVEHLHEPLQISTLAAQASVSQSHFFALFKRQTGTAPIDYFIRLRMNHARQLLDSTCSSVKEIAATMGYDDPFYFSRVFKSVHRVAPAEYRRRNGQDRTTLQALSNRPVGSLAISLRPVAKQQSRISFD